MIPQRLKIGTAADLILIIACIAGAVAVARTMGQGLPTTVVVYRENRVAAQYPLDRDGEFTLRGAVGDMTIAVHNGAVRVVKSQCPRHICAHSQPITRPGRQIICAPNRIVIEIRSPQSTDIPDAVVR